MVRGKVQNARFVSPLVLLQKPSNLILDFSGAWKALEKKVLENFLRKTSTIPVSAAFFETDILLCTWFSCCVVTFGILTTLFSDLCSLSLRWHHTFSSGRRLCSCKQLSILLEIGGVELAIYQTLLLRCRALSVRQRNKERSLVIANEKMLAFTKQSHSVIWYGRVGKNGWKLNFPPKSFATLPPASRGDSANKKEPRA